MSVCVLATIHVCVCLYVRVAYHSTPAHFHLPLLKRQNPGSRMRKKKVFNSLQIKLDHWSHTAALLIRHCQLGALRTALSVGSTLILFV